jgi:polysaccharide export outer membrane protein
MPFDRSIAILCVTGGALLAGCAPKGSDLPVLTQTSSINSSYVLGTGDRLQITLYGGPQNDRQPTTTGADGIAATEVSEAGTVDAPMIGSVPATGLTVDDLKREITTKLADGYVKDPKVAVNILSYRPFYIVGEVNHPGSYPCTARSRVLSAVATAGGFTYRANEEFVVVERKEGGKIITGRLDPDAAILPDDVIRVTQRYY